MSSDEPPEGMRWAVGGNGAYLTLVPVDDPEPTQCPDIGFGHDSQACVTCLRRRAWAKQTALQVEDDDGDSWAAQDLTMVEDLPAPSILQIMLGKFLFRRGWVHLLHGEFGSGKTPLCYIAVVEQVKLGNLGMILDYEMGHSQAKLLLRELGLTDEEIRNGVYFCHQPTPINETGRRRVRDDIAAFGRDLTVAVVDSLTESMATTKGASDNDALDVAAWYASIPKWLAQEFDAAVLVIDHSALGDGPRPSGSHKKREVPQFHVHVKKVKSFSKVEAGGRSNLIVYKDRSGESVIGKTVAVLLAEPGGTFFVTTPEDAKERQPSERGDIAEFPFEDQPEDSTYEDVYADLLQAGYTGIGKTDLTGRGQAGKYRRRAVDRLIEEGKAVTRPKPGTTGVLVWAVEFEPK